MNSTAPIFVGRFTQRLDGHSRLRMPESWRTAGEQTWLLHPHTLSACHRNKRHVLCLLPVIESTAGRILSSLGVAPGKSTTLDAAANAMRADAKRRSLDPSLISLGRTDSPSIYLKLSEAQLDWLGARGRSIVLCGALTAVNIWAPAEWDRFVRELQSPHGGETVKPEPSI